MNTEQKIIVRTPVFLRIIGFPIIVAMIFVSFWMVYKGVLGEGLSTKQVILYISIGLVCFIMFFSAMGTIKYWGYIIVANLSGFKVIHKNNKQAYNWSDVAKIKDIFWADSSKIVDNDGNILFYGSNQTPGFKQFKEIYKRTNNA